MVDEKTDVEGEDKGEPEKEKVDLGRLSSATVKDLPIWDSPGEKFDLGGAITATELAKKLTPNVAVLEQFGRLGDLHSKATDRLNELSAADHVRDQLKQQKIDRGISFEPPSVLSLAAHRDRRKEEHQEELIAVLRAQNEKSAALIELNESAYLHAINSSKSNTRLTWCSILIAAAVLVFTVYDRFSPLQPTVTIESPVADAEERSEPVTKPDNAEAKEVISGQTVTEEPGQPQPSPTAAHAPADNAPSSSDQREP